MELRCKRCGSGGHVRNGPMRGQQRYRRKACGLNVTDTPARGKPTALKITAVLLYVSGLSMNRTAKLLGVSTPSVQAWLEQVAKAYAPEPAPGEGGRALVSALDEVGPYRNESPTSSGCGQLGLVLRGGSWTGRAAVAIALPSSGC